MDLFLIYLVCFGAGFVVTLLMALVGEFFGHDADFAGSDVPGAGVLSPLTIAMFVTAFGGFGLILRKIPALSSPWANAPVAMVLAVGVAAVLVALLRMIFRRTQSSSESRISAVVGLEGTIVTPIPENGVGEVAYVDGGTRYTAPARETDGQPIAGGMPVRIARVVGTQFYVRKI